MAAAKSFVFSTFLFVCGQTTVHAQTCTTNPTYTDQACVRTSILTGWVGGAVTTKIEVNNTTSQMMIYRFDFNNLNGGFGGPYVVSPGGITPGLSFGLVQEYIPAGQSWTLLLTGYSSCAPCQADTDQSVTQQFSIRSYVYAPTLDLLNQQNGLAIKATVGYNPAVVTTALPWGFLTTAAVSETSLTSLAGTSITETPFSGTILVTDRHSMISIVNPDGRADLGTLPAVTQQVKITVLDSMGNPTGVSFTTPPLVGDGMFPAAYLNTLFPNNTMLPAGANTDTQVKLLVQGLSGGRISVSTIELDGGPYAINTVPTWPLTQ